MKTINGAMFDGVVRVSTRACGRARCDGDDEGDARAMDLKFGFQKRGARIRIARRLGTSSRARTTGEDGGGGGKYPSSGLKRSSKRLSRTGTLRPG